MSAGGEFNYEFAAWKPDRVIAFVVNKGNIYYTALVSREARSVPALLFVGEKDLEFRTNTITGLFAVNRRGGALWALTMEPGVAHAVGRSRDLGAMFFEDVLPLRLGTGDAGGSSLRPIDESSGFVADLKTLTFQPRRRPESARRADVVAADRTNRAGVAGRGVGQAVRLLTTNREVCRDRPFLARARVDRARAAVS